MRYHFGIFILSVFGARTRSYAQLVWFGVGLGRARHQLRKPFCFLYFCVIC